MQVHHLPLRHLRTRLHHKLSHIRIANGKHLHIVHISLQQHAVDMAGSNHLLIYNSTYIKISSHIEIIKVLHLSNGLSHSATASSNTREDILLIIVSQRDESIHIAITLLFKKIHIKAISIDYQSIASLHQSA